MVRLNVALTAVSARSAQDLLDALRFLIVGTKPEPGNRGGSAWIDPDGSVRYVEVWATEPDMQRRVRSDDFRSLLAILENAKDAQLQFDFVTTTRGLDYVQEVRGLGREEPAE